jgi:hypothetical protein
MWYSNLERTFISRHILHQHWYTCPISLPVLCNPQHRNLLSAFSNFRTGSDIICDFRKSIRELPCPVVNRFTRQTLSTLNKKHFFMNILCIESLCPQKTHNRTLLFGSSLLNDGRHFDYWNQPLNLRIRVCCLDCHEAGLCCYVVIHIETLLRPLQLFYFHLWPIYWLSLVEPPSSVLKNTRDKSQEAGITPQNVLLSIATITRTSNPTQKDWHQHFV